MDTGLLHTRTANKVSCSGGACCLKISCPDYVFFNQHIHPRLVDSDASWTLGTPGRRYNVSVTAYMSSRATHFLSAKRVGCISDSGIAHRSAVQVCVNQGLHLSACSEAVRVELGAVFLLFGACGQMQRPNGANSTRPCSQYLANISVIAHVVLLQHDDGRCIP